MNFERDLLTTTTTTTSTTSSTTTSTTTAGYYYQYYENEATCDGFYSSTCWETYYPINTCINTLDDSSVYRYAMMTYVSGSSVRISFYGTSDSLCTGSVVDSYDYIINQCTSFTSYSYPASEIVSSTNDNYCSGAEHLGASATLVLGLIALVKTFF